MHTKRTGHSEFADKTSEAVKPISLEVQKDPKGDVDMEEDAGGSNSGQVEGTVRCVCTWFCVSKLTIDD